MTSWKASSTKGVDEQVVDRGEVRAEGHVVQVGVRFGRAEGCIDQFLVLAGQRQTPAREELLQRSELAHRQIVPEAARTAMRQERKAAVPQAEALRHAAQTFVRGEFHGFTLAEVVPAAVAAELRHLFVELRKRAARDEPVHPGTQGVGGAVVADVRGVFAPRGPLGRDAQGLADFDGGSFGHHAATQFGRDTARLLRGTLTAPGTRWGYVHRSRRSGHGARCVPPPRRQADRGPAGSWST